MKSKINQTTKQIPYNDWRRFKKGSSSVGVEVKAARTTFQYNFFLLKEATDIDAPMASGNNWLWYEFVNSDNKLNQAEHAANIAEAAICSWWTRWMKENNVET